MNKEQTGRNDMNESFGDYNFINVNQHTDRFVTRTGSLLNSHQERKPNQSLSSASYGEVVFNDLNR